VAQGVGPEFKPQTTKKRKKTTDSVLSFTLVEATSPTLNFFIFWYLSPHFYKTRVVSLPLNF
jgi:hypothetical protein